MPFTTAHPGSWVTIRVGLISQQKGRDADSHHRCVCEHVTFGDPLVVAGSKHNHRLCLKDQRPFEIRNLFDPAFCGLVLFRGLQGYEENDARGVPYSLSLLVRPLCRHKPSREALAAGSRGYPLRVAEKNPRLRVLSRGRPRCCPKRSRDSACCWNVAASPSAMTVA
jgi:hypothetical protein